MTTAYRDTATRCRRCERVVPGCATFSVSWQHDFGTVTVAESWLCMRCRNELHAVVGKMLHDGGSR